MKKILIGVMASLTCLFALGAVLAVLIPVMDAFYSGPEALWWGVLAIPFSAASYLLHKCIDRMENRA